MKSVFFFFNVYKEKIITIEIDEGAERLVLIQKEPFKKEKENMTIHYLIYRLHLLYKKPGIGGWSYCFLNIYEV